MSETNGSSAGRRERRKFSAAEKLRIVLSGLQADTKISELCRREGISATQFYQWKDRLLGSAAKVFEDKSSGPSDGPGTADSGGGESTTPSGRIARWAIGPQHRRRLSRGLKLPLRSSSRPRLKNRSRKL